MAGDDDGRVVALAREVERIARRIDAHGGRVDRVEQLTRELHRMQGELADRIETLAAPADGDDDGEEARRLSSWLAADDPELARALLADLCEWLGAVYLRYHGAALPSCWAWHPAVIEELLWLRHAHRAAYEGRGASWRDIGDWHDRQRPGVTRRIREAIGDCELARHVEGADRHRQAPLQTPLATRTDQIAQTWTAHRTTPAPTDQQLHEAEQHDRTDHRSSIR
jgi:hypothetical protein